MKMEPIVSSETSAIRIQTPGNYPKRNKLHLEHGESLKTRIYFLCFISLSNSSLVLILHIWSSFVGSNILLKFFLSKPNNFWIVVSFSAHVSEAYVTTGLMTAPWTVLVSRLSQQFLMILKMEFPEDVEINCVFTRSLHWVQYRGLDI